MKREVVQDFLNLPGIAGLALIDGRSRPYFCGVDRSLNFQQKEALAQGIQQVIDTTPADFEFFEFHFNGHQVYIYKLNHGIILLVLAVDSLSSVAYAELVEQLKRELQQDVANSIATFRLLAGNTTLSGQNYWKQGMDTLTKPTASQPSSPPLSSPPAPVPPPLTAPSDSPSPAPLPAAVSASASLEEVLAAINHLSKFTSQYLGSTVVTNYWKTTRPSAEWLQQFQVERSAQITCSGVGTTLSTEEMQWIHEWVNAFINRCAKVIRDFPKTVRQTGLNDRQRLLLFAE